MNLLHMKYAVEIAKIGSINKAAEELYVAQPNLSRSIKELESDLGITIFDRSSKGMTLTPQGENFINYAKSILKQVDDLEKICRSDVAKKQRLSISVPRASYISEAFVNFSKRLDDNSTEIFYMETNQSRAISNIIDNGYRLGIVRYKKKHEGYFINLFKEKELTYEPVAEFKYVVLLNNENPLSQKESVTFDDLKPYIEISHGDPYVPSLKMNMAMKEEKIIKTERNIYLFERGSQFDLLCENPNTFMWVSPIPPKLMTRYNLCQKPCLDNINTYKDVLIKKKDYKPTDVDNMFIEELIESKRKYLDKQYLSDNKE